MKIFVAVGLMCLVGLVVSYPARPEEEIEQRTIRRRNGPAPEQLRARQPEVFSRPEKRKVVEVPTAAASRNYETPKRKNSPAVLVQDDSPIEARDGDYNAEASNAYAGYNDYVDDSHTKFEQGVQNYANSYNSDQGVKDGRLQFSISGQQGPHSYRFGYDTGKGADRVFRFEERDQQGIVHGRYGYYDPSGKFRIVNYSAHPEHGFSAEGNFGPK